MPTVKGHTRRLASGKRIRIKGYSRKNPVTKVKRHWRKAHERKATHVGGTRVHSHSRTY